MLISLSLCVFVAKKYSYVNDTLIFHSPLTLCHYSLFTTHHSPLTTHNSPFTIPNFPSFIPNKTTSSLLFQRFSRRGHFCSCYGIAGFRQDHYQTNCYRNTLYHLRRQPGSKKKIHHMPLYKNYFSRNAEATEVRMRKL